MTHSCSSPKYSQQQKTNWLQNICISESAYLDLFYLDNLVQSPILCHDLVHIWTFSQVSSLPISLSGIFRLFFYLGPVQTTTACFMSFPDVFLPKLLTKFRDHLDHFMPWISALHIEVLEAFCSLGQEMSAWISNLPWYHLSTPGNNFLSLIIS